MTNRTFGMLLFWGAMSCLAEPAASADRVHAGLWEQSVTVAGKMMTRPHCISQAEAQAINGDAKSIQGYLDQLSAPSGCKVTDVKIDGNQVTVKSVCADGKENTGTTTYHGDRYETVNTNGTTSQGKWVGACK